MTSILDIDPKQIKSRTAEIAKHDNKCRAESESFATTMHDLAKNNPAALKRLVEEQDQSVTIRLNKAGRILGTSVLLSGDYDDIDLKDYIDQIALFRYDTCKRSR